MVEAASVFLSDNVLHDDEWTSPVASDTSLVLEAEDTVVLPRKEALEHAYDPLDGLDSLVAPTSQLYALYDLKKSHSGPNATGEMMPLSFGQEDVQRKRSFLAYGGSDHYPEPFTFYIGDEQFVSFSSGVGAFVYELHTLLKSHGKDTLLHHTEDMMNYLSYSFSHEEFDLTAAEVLEGLRESGLPQEEKFDQLVSFITTYVDDLREVLLLTPNGSWMGEAGIYHLVADQYNLKGFREFHDRADASMSGKFLADFNRDDALYHRDRLGRHVLLFSGIFPKGERFRKGTGHGSPYCIRHHLKLDSPHGVAEDLNEKMNMLESLGMRGLIDFVPNHTSADSWLLEEDPTLFVHKLVQDADEQPPEGSFEYLHNGKRYFIAHGAFDDSGKHGVFSDTAQLDIDNPRTRARLIEIAREQKKLFGHHGIRLDMADCVTQEYFRRLWNERYRKEHGWPVPESSELSQKEFLTEFTDAMKELDPHFAIVTESYGKRHTPGRAGCTSAMNKCDHEPTYGKYRYGFLDSIHTLDPYRIAHATHGHAYDYYQIGGVSGTIGSGNYDEPPLKRALAERADSHAFALLAFVEFMPGSSLTAPGAEIGIDQYLESDLELEGCARALPFSRAIQIDWQRGDLSMLELIEEVQQIKLGVVPGRKDISFFQVLPECLRGGTDWVGYHHGAYTALLNPLDHEVAYTYFDNGVERTGILSPGSFAVIERKFGSSVLEVEGRRFGRATINQGA